MLRPDYEKEMVMVGAGKKADHDYFIEKIYPLKLLEYHNLAIDLKEKSDKDFDGVTKELGEEIRKAIFFSVNIQEAYRKLKELDLKVLDCWIKIEQFAILKYLKY